MRILKKKIAPASREHPAVIIMLRNGVETQAIIIWALSANGVRILHAARTANGCRGPSL